MQLSEVRPIVDPEALTFLRSVDWHLAFGPRNISRWHPLLDRRIFVPNPTWSQCQTTTLLIHVYTPGRRLPAPHTSRLSIRVYQHARVRDLFYEICDGLGAVIDKATLALLPDDDQRRIMAAQRWRVGQGFMEIGTTSVRTADDTPTLFADLLNGDFVLSHLTPVHVADGAFALSVLFKA